MPGGSLTRGITDVRATGLYGPNTSGGVKREKGVWELADAASLLAHVTLPFYSLLVHYEACPDMWDQEP